MNSSSGRFRVLALGLILGGGAAVQPCRAGAPSQPASPSPRSLYQLDAAWVGDDGVPFRLSELRGHPVVLAMIFTQCGSACPVTVEEMKHLERSLAAGVGDQTRFVLVSFDSKGDTPAVLRAYREHSGLGGKRWILLHGNPDQVRELAMVLGVSYSQVRPGLFSHSSLVSVLNRQGEVVIQRPNLQGITADAIRALNAGP